MIGESEVENILHAFKNWQAGSLFYHMTLTLQL